MKRISLLLLALLVLSLATSGWAQGNPNQRGRKGAKLFKKMDANNDRQISRSEWTRKPKAFEHLDRNNDGVLTVEEVRLARQQRPRQGENSPSVKP